MPRLRPRIARIVALATVAIFAPFAVDAQSIPGIGNGGNVAGLPNQTVPTTYVSSNAVPLQCAYFANPLNPLVTSGFWGLTCDATGALRVAGLSGGGGAAGPSGSTGTTSGTASYIQGVTGGTPIATVLGSGGNVIGSVANTGFALTSSIPAGSATIGNVGLTGQGTTTGSPLFSQITGGSTLGGYNATQPTFANGAASVLQTDSHGNTYVLPAPGTTFAVQSSLLDTNGVGTITATDTVVAAPSNTGATVSGASTAGSYVALVNAGGASSWSSQIGNLGTGTLYFETSYDSTTGADGNWIPVNGRQSGISSGSNVAPFTTTNGVFTGNWSGAKWFRVRAVGTLSGTPAIVERASNGTGATFLSSALPPGPNLIGSVNTPQIPSSSAGTSQTAAVGIQGVTGGVALNTHSIDTPTAAVPVVDPAGSAFAGTGRNPLTATAPGANTVGTTSYGLGYTGTTFVPNSVDASGNQNVNLAASSPGAAVGSPIYTAPGTGAAGSAAATPAYQRIVDNTTTANVAAVTANGAVAAAVRDSGSGTTAGVVAPGLGLSNTSPGLNVNAKLFGYDRTTASGGYNYLLQDHSSIGVGGLLTTTTAAYKSVATSGYTAGTCTQLTTQTSPQIGRVINVVNTGTSTPVLTLYDQTTNTCAASDLIYSVTLPANGAIPNFPAIPLTKGLGYSLSTSISSNVWFLEN